jgi:YHS domain-containing protein/uncharacterized membrane protein YraQ (UPF0718 family)
MDVLGILGQSLLDGLGMFWATLWALVLGFALSGAVQAFVSRAKMQQALGNERPATIAKAGFFGAVSSSCSYAASALAKTLFARGASFTAAQAFMFASTNLVVELGIVLWLLLGWQFALAEFVGGALMIVLLALVLPRAIPSDDLERARRRLNRGGSPEGEHEGHVEAGDDGSTARVRSLAGWADAAGYTISDLTMLRKELFTGFLVAGFLDVAVPVSAWQSLFITGHGFWSSLENVVLGPFLAVISSVCSVGNVPLAAALWTGGITFGGVVAFVFADLIALPLLLIYRRYYGTGLTGRLLVVFWATMGLSGLAVEYLFTALGIVPQAATGRHGAIGRDVFGWNYTTVLDIVALAGFALLYWLYRNRERFGGGAGYAKDPVCGMQVETAHAPATAQHHGRTYYFCSDHCHERFAGDPERFAESAAGDAQQASDDAQVTDPVCGMTIDPRHAAAHVEWHDRTYHFCNQGCRDAFVNDPDAYLVRAPCRGES